MIVATFENGNWHVASVASSVATTVRAVTAPMANSFTKLLDRAFLVADWVCVATIMWSGAMWIFGNRTKALEHFIGTCIGYLIIRYAQDIQWFLSTL